MTPRMVPRAERVPLKIPIAYHQPGEDLWFQARAINVSESGMLFESSDLLPGAPVEVLLSPPIQIGELPPGKQVCMAHVVRTEVHTVAVRFEACRFWGA